MSDGDMRLMFRPSLGAFFASRPPLTLTQSPDKLNVYSVPAAITLTLLLIETAYLAISLPETKSWRKLTETGAKKVSAITKAEVGVRRNRLKVIGRLHGTFLLLFSGVSLNRLGRTFTAENTCSTVLYSTGSVWVDNDQTSGDSS